MICFIPVVLVLVWYCLRVFTRFPERTVEDVYPFFHRIEGEALKSAFLPELEDVFRVALSVAEFKKWQQKRIHLAMHLCRNISANSRLLVGWAVFERNENWQLHEDTVREGLRGFQIACMHARTAAFAVRLRLRFRLVRMALLPMLPVPSFSTLVEHSNTLIEFYHTAETLAKALSSVYGEEIHENMLAVLGMLDLEPDGLGN
jgi:hypothetical protein